MNNDDLEKRVAEIENLVASYQLNKATKRLMDFTKDFAVNRERQITAISLKAEYTSLREAKIGYERSEEVNRKFLQLGKKILEEIDLIKEEFNNLPFVASEAEINLPQSQAKIPPDQANKIKSRIKPVGKTPLEKIKSKFIEDKQQQYNNTLTILEAKGVTKQFKSKHLNFTLHPIDITLKFGEITAIVGENGNGKTTLLKILAGELLADQGEINYPYLQDRQTDSYYIKQQIAYIPQELPRWPGLLADNLHFAASIRGITGQDNEDEVDFIIHRLGLNKYRNVTWNEISGGYKMRFSLARIMLTNPKLIVLDEPLANLDINTRLIFLQDLRDLANSLSNPMSVLVSSQNIYLVEDIADNIVFIEDGEAKYNGTIQDFGNDREENIYEIACNASKERIIDLLDNTGCKKVEDVGSNFIIQTSLEMTTDQLLNYFLEQGIEIKYFRDISKSTRKLFEIQQ